MMMAAQILGEALRGELRLNEPLSRHTTWRAGGTARCLYRPADLEDLATFLRSLPPEEPLLWLGLGSNLLVRDGGFDGTVIHTLGNLDRIERSGDTGLVVESGASCAGVARFAARSALRGVEFFAGIPGTVGGALAMNAGAFGATTWPLVREVVTIDRQGALHRHPPTQFEIGYRQVRGPTDQWFVTAHLELSCGDTTESMHEVRKLLERRASSQPIGQPSCGSVFRNPPGDHAARLIEAAGLKGMQVGGAEVSRKHANFITHNGSGTATEIEMLIEQVEQRVAAQFGVHLEREVHIVGRESTRR